MTDKKFYIYLGAAMVFSSFVDVLLALWVAVTYF